MDFSYSELQNILLNSAKKFLENETKDLFRQVEKTKEGYSPALWEKMAELGWLGVVFPEEAGGIGGTFVDLVLLIEEMGKTLFPGPFISTVISGLSILHYGNESHREDYLPGLIEGNLIASPAFTMPEPGMGQSKVEEHVRVKNGKYLISGTRLFVPFAHMADLFIYGADTEQGKVVFLINAKSPGITCTALDAIAGDKPCAVNLEGVEVAKENMLGVAEKGEEIVIKIEEWGALAHSAFITGMLEQVLKMSVEYAKEREQFGRKIGSFQAIQHHCANIAMDVDRVKFLTYEAAWKLSENLPAKKEIAMAKAWASDASRRVCLLGVKIHGGTGVSEEHDMQLYFRRAKGEEVTFGNGDYHREIIAQQLGL